jgi:hypothetical protein
MLPAVVAHADWSIHAKKRWLACATRQPGGDWHITRTELVGHTESLLQQLTTRAVLDGPLLVGFDFPIGLPRAYAEAAGVRNFREALLKLGTGDWSEFFTPASQLNEVTVQRPFYPAGNTRKGEANRADFARTLGVVPYDQLLRECESRTSTRNAACALFWTLGRNQVGKAAISGWQEILAPALRDDRNVGLWPFDGTLNELLAKHTTVLAETYPGEFYGHLGLDLRKRDDDETKSGKTSQGTRRLNATALLNNARRLNCQTDNDATTEIANGFGSRADGEDRFDAFVGLLGMINVVVGVRPEGQSSDPRHRRIEGWILGQDASAKPRIDQH